MNIVKILGGMGNQMFQYALAVALRERFPATGVALDPECFRGYPLHNGYELPTIFPLTIGAASRRQIMRLTWPLFHYRLWQVGRRVLPMRSRVVYDNNTVSPADPRLLQADPRGRYYDGYWQSEAYFADAADAVRREFTFPDFDTEANRKLAERISRCVSVSIHIRRGDYISHPYFKDICTTTYYRRAITEIKRLAPTELLVVFSNDITWCRENFSNEFGDTEVVFVDWNTGAQSFRDMQLMSLCRHNIIANSSFSWWGAWLNVNPDKIVLAPSKWQNMHANPDVIPAAWKTIAIN